MLGYDKLREADRMRSGYQDLAAKGLLTYEALIMRSIASVSSASVSSGSA